LSAAIASRLGFSQMKTSRPATFQQGGDRTRKRSEA
jgi:hypothetical protein